MTFDPILLERQMGMHDRVFPESFLQTTNVSDFQIFHLHCFKIFNFVPLHFYVNYEINTILLHNPKRGSQELIDRTINTE